MKSMCHEARRNSPSVADCSPASSCLRTIVADRLVLDPAQLGRVDRAGGEVVARLRAAAAAAAGCRRGRRGTAASCAACLRLGCGLGHLSSLVTPSESHLVKARRSSRRGSSPRPRRRHVAQLGQLQLLVERVAAGRRCSIDVIHHEKCSARQTRRRQSVGVRVERVAAAVAVPRGRARRRARARRASARFRPFAPVGGTMCAASPARNSRPCCIGSATKLRIAGDALLERPAPRRASSRRARCAPAAPPRSGRRATRRCPRRDGTGGRARLRVGERRLSSAKPRSWWL